MKRLMMFVLCGMMSLMAAPHTVTVILEFKEERAEEMKLELLKIAALSRLEDSCLQYEVHQDNQNVAKFALRETWKSKELHAEQFSKDYIINFCNLAEDALVKPYEVVIGAECFD